VLTGLAADAVARIATWELVHQGFAAAANPIQRSVDGWQAQGGIHAGQRAGGAVAGVRAGSAGARLGCSTVDGPNALLALAQISGAQANRSAALTYLDQASRMFDMIGSSEPTSAFAYLRMAMFGSALHWRLGDNRTASA
jgi:hypothetical protein